MYNGDHDSRGSTNHVQVVCFRYYWTKINQARLGRATPLGQPRSVYKSDVECCFLSRNGWMTLKVNDPFFSILLKRIPRCIFGANLAILAQISDELLHGQAKFPRIIRHNGQNDLEGQGEWPPFSITGESVPGCMFGANLVILAEICDELLCGQSKFHRILRQNGQITLMVTVVKLQNLSWYKTGFVSR